MTWELLLVREVADDDDTDGDDGNDFAYPLPTGEPNAIALDARDGGYATQPVTTIRLNALSTEGAKPRSVAKAEDVEALLYVTDSRVAVACTKYDKGGGWMWYGFGIAFNVVSKLRAARRRKGKALVGHVRYEWLASVGYTTKTGWTSDESVRFVAVSAAGDERRLIALDLVLPKSSSAESVARDVVRRAAAYRLAHTQIDSAEERAQIETLLDPPRLEAAGHDFAVWSFPTYFVVQ